MTIRQSFFEATKIKNFWNTTIEWNGLKLARVGWLHNGWMIIDTNKTFEDAADRQQQHIAEFHTQAELWEHIKSNLI